MNFNGKVVLITGGAEKAGKIFALEFARAGADLVISHHNMSQQANQTKREIEEIGSKCLVMEANNRNTDQLKLLISNIRSYYGRLDVLVHNASNFNDQSIDQVTEEVWNSSMEIILK